MFRRRLSTAPFTTILLRVGVGLTLGLLSASGWAFTVTNPGTPNLGGYTVNWSYSGALDCQQQYVGPPQYFIMVCYGLEEVYNGGTPVETQPSGNSVTYSGKATGTYTYKILRAESTGSTTTIEGPITVSVVAQPSFSINNTSVSEGGNLSFTVTRSQGIADTSTVYYSTATGTAGSGDFSATSGTLSFTSGQTSKTVTVSTTEESIYEGTERLYVNLSSPTNATISDSQGYGDITNDDSGPSFSVNNTSVSEGGTLSFTVSKSGGTAFSHNVSYSTGTGTASSSDFTATSGTLTFTSGQTSKTVTVSTTEESTYENTERLYLNLSSATSGASISDASGYGDITNDDSAPAFSINNVSVSEGGSLSFTVTKSGSTALSHNVSYASATGTAGSGDFTATSGTHTFTSGQTSKTVSVSTTEESTYENSERLYVNLSSATSGATISDSQGWGDITNDDAGPSFSINDVSVSEGGSLSFTVTKSGSTALSHNVSYATATGTAGSGDFTAITTTALTFTSSETSKAVVVSTTEDSTYENTERLYVNLSSATSGATISDSQGNGDITNDDAGPSFSINDVSVSEGGTLSFTVTKTGPTEASHNVSYATATGTAGSSDFTAASSSLTFTSAQTTQSVNIATTEESIYENTERLYVNLSNPTNATISDSQGYGDITNDDTGPSFSIDDVSIAEGGALAFTVTKSGSTEVSHNVSYATAIGTAGSGDFTAITTTALSFTSAQTTQAVSVTTTQDSIYEDTEALYVNLSSATSGATISDSQGGGSITNDGDAGPVFAIQDASITEGTALSFTVTKTGLTEATHAVNFASSDGTAIVSSDYTGNSGTVSFTSAETSKPVTVTTIADGTFEVTENMYVKLSSPTNSASASATAAMGTIVDAEADGDTSGLFVVDPASSGEGPGLTPGGLNIDAMGNANFSMPIAVAPGTAGMQPNLALTYSSSGGNGFAGVGWSVSGFSAITRCPQRMEPDGEFGTIDYDGDDRFCLDGARLIAISGTYGASGTEYRTEIDQFSRITSYGTAGSGPQYFTVERKAGQYLEYGNTADSRIEAKGLSEVRVWAANKVMDGAQNFLTIEYEEDTDQTDFRPDLIEYTMNTAASLTNPFASVEFVWETRTDVTGASQYVGGSALSRSKKRLSNIKSWNGTDLVRDYDLAYDNNGVAGASRLISVTEKTDTAQFDPIEFTWAGSNVTPDFDAATVSVEFPTSTGWDDFHPAIGDFNGDALTDVFLQAKTTANSSVLLLASVDSNGDTSLDIHTSLSFSDDWAAEETSPIDSSKDDLRQIVTGDFNADGITDLALLSLEWKSTQSTPITHEVYDQDFTIHHTSVSGSTVSLSAQTAVSLATSANYEPTLIHTADFNGDGRTDLAFETIYSASVNDIYITTSSGTLGTPTSASVTELIGDFNGDGMADYMTDTGTTYLYDGSAHNSTSSNTLPTGDRALADFNRDGLTDVLSYDDTGNKISINFGTGDGTFTSSADVVMTGVNAQPVLGDWNRDGLTDVAIPDSGSSETDFHINTGDITSSASTFFDAFLSMPGWDDDEFLVADFNGDGVGDFWHRTTGATPTNTLYTTDADDSTTDDVYYPDVITKFTNNLDVVTEVVYMPMSDSDVYTRAESEYGTGAYPNWTIQTARLLVERVIREDGDGSTRATAYDYKHAQTDLERRGGLLFGEIKITDELTEIVQTTVYRQDFPFVGMPIEVRSTYEGVTPVVDLGLTEYTYPDNDVADPAVTTHTGVYFPHARSQTTRSYELTYNSATPPAVNGNVLTGIAETLTPDADFDTYGNLEDVTIKVYESESGGNPTGLVLTTATSNSFYNNGTGWMLGKLTCSTSTATPTGGTAKTSKVGFNYNLTNGMVTSEVIEPTTGLVTGCVTGSSDDNITLKTSYSYDGFGNRTQISVDDLSTAAGGSLPARATSISYGELSSTNTVAASNGRFAIIVTNAESQTEYREHDARFGSIIRLEGPNGLETDWTYDSHGRQTAEIRADGTRTDIYRETCTSATCNGIINGVKVVTLSTGSAPAAVVSDQYGREVMSAQIAFSGTPVISETSYNSRGEIDEIEKPYLYDDQPTTSIHTAFSYDVLGRIENALAPGETDGTDTVYLGPGTDTSVTPNISYQSGIEVTNDKDQTATEYYDARGLLIAALDANGTATRYEYDAHANLTSVEVDNDSDTEIVNTYDILGRKLTMDDPDLSPDAADEWTYKYNSFGELRYQEDPNGNDTVLAYDEIGRVTMRTENTSDVTSYTYDVYDSTNKGVGKLSSVTGPEGDAKTYIYDNKGRLDTTETDLPGIDLIATEDYDFVTSQTYDTAGRVDVITYPESTEYANGLPVRYDYNAHGYLVEVSNNSTSDSYWELTEQTTTSTKFTLGNGISTQHSYDEATGYLTAIGASRPFQTNDVQSLEYAFDILGNLIRRQDNNRDVRELINTSTGYDDLNRILEVKRETYSASTWGSSTTALSLTYDDLGNVLTKTGLSSYSYGSPDASCTENDAGPHAVTGVGTQDFCYDANGNEVSGYDYSTSSTRTTTWTAYNKPATITDGTDTVTFSYGADRARFKQVNGFGGATVTTYYVDGLFELEATGSDETAVHYIFAGGEAVAIYKSHDDSTEETLYLHKDHLGSVAEITDDAGTLVESLAYDAFGKRLDATDWDGDPSALPADTPRGYTGHEQLDDIGLIHMNGRVYDPDLGRMISADPIVQSPTFSQSFNRYSYVINNPLRYTDPSGFCFQSGNGCSYGGIGSGSWGGGFSGGGPQFSVNILIHRITNIWLVPRFAAALPGFYVPSGGGFCIQDPCPGFAFNGKDDLGERPRVSIESGDFIFDGYDIIITTEIRVEVSITPIDLGSAKLETIKEKVFEVPVDLPQHTAAGLRNDSHLAIDHLQIQLDQIDASMAAARSKFKSPQQWAADLEGWADLRAAEQYANALAVINTGIRTYEIGSAATGIYGLGRLGWVAGRYVLTRAARSIPKRLPRDVAVNPSAPAVLDTTSRSIGRASHNQALQQDLANLPRGATDIRVNQQQVNALGQRVGINRPDLQYTVNGRRYYIEYEGIGAPRGLAHSDRLLANDPVDGLNVIVKEIP